MLSGLQPKNLSMKNFVRILLFGLLAFPATFMIAVFMWLEQENLSFLNSYKMAIGIK